MIRDHGPARPEDDPLLEAGLQLASRLMSLVKSGRAYAVGHVAFTQQLDNYLRLLEPVFASRPTVRIESPDGDVCLNGVRLPWRANMQRSLEHLAQEFGARHIDGVEFSRGLTLHELSRFMLLFLPGEVWKGAELLSACADARLVNVRPLPQRSRVREQGEHVAAIALPSAPGSSRDAWGAVIVAAQSLLSEDALDQGVELRHVRRLMHPLVDATLAGERVAAALAHVTPGEPAWAHAAHTSLTSLCLGARLGLPRADLSDLALAALLHDVGHDGSNSAVQGDPAASHTHAGLRRLAWATTFNRTSLAVMSAAFEHHGEALRPGGTGRPSLFSQVVAMADAYTTLLASGEKPEEWLSPGDALALVIGPLRSQWHPALPAALVRALGVHPPGQWIELDDGSIARALGCDPDSPERPWLESEPEPHGARLSLVSSAAVPLQQARRVLRALPRHEWPDEGTRAAA